MRTTFAPKTLVPRIFAGSRSDGMKIHAFRPSRAACAATAFARLPVEEHETVSNPNARAWERATATTRSLKLSVGKHTASFLMYKFPLALVPLKRSASRGAWNNGVKPTGNRGVKPWGRGNNSEYRHMLGGGSEMRSRATDAFSAS